MCVFQKTIYLMGFGPRRYIEVKWWLKTTVGVFQRDEPKKSPEFLWSAKIDWYVFTVHPNPSKTNPSTTKTHGGLVYDELFRFQPVFFVLIFCWGGSLINPQDLCHRVPTWMVLLIYGKIVGKYTNSMDPLRLRTICCFFFHPEDDDREIVSLFFVERMLYTMMSQEGRKKLVSTSCHHTPYILPLLQYIMLHMLGVMSSCTYCISWSTYLFDDMMYILVSHQPQYTPYLYNVGWNPFTNRLPISHPSRLFSMICCNLGIDTGKEAWSIGVISKLYLAPA